MTNDERMTKLEAGLIALRNKRGGSRPFVIRHPGFVIFHLLALALSSNPRFSR